MNDSIRNCINIQKRLRSFVCGKKYALYDKSEYDEAELKLHYIINNHKLLYKVFSLSKDNAEYHLEILSSMAKEIDKWLDNNLVMCDDILRRHIRVSLLASAEDLYSKFADFTKINATGK